MAVDLEGALNEEWETRESVLLWSIGPGLLVSCSGNASTPGAWTTRIGSLACSEDVLSRSNAFIGLSLLQRIVSSSPEFSLSVSPYRRVRAQIGITLSIPLRPLLSAHGYR
jgi:hypothetical protein